MEEHETTQEADNETQQFVSTLIVMFCACVTLFIIGSTILSSLNEVRFTAMFGGFETNDSSPYITSSDITDIWLAQSATKYIIIPPTIISIIFLVLSFITLRRKLTKFNIIANVLAIAALAISIAMPQMINENFIDTQTIKDPSPTISELTDNENPPDNQPDLQNKNE